MSVNQLQKTETLIIGAGPAGMSAAMDLSKHGKDFVVVEKDSKVGGLSKTYEIVEEDGSKFLTDNGPHRFFSKNPYLYEFIEGLLGEEWIEVKRQTRQYIDGVFFEYPINFKQVLRDIPFTKLFRMGLDYIWAFVRYKLFKKEIKTFKDHVYANFGKTLGEFNMINYTEKIWGVPADTLHPDWAKQRIKGLNLRSILMNAVKRVGKKSTKGGPKSLVDVFYYPQFGTGLIYDTIEKKLRDDGYSILKNSEPLKIHHHGRYISHLEIKNSDGTISTIEADNIVESVPVVHFLDLLDPPPPSNVLKARDALRYRSQVYVFLTLDRETVTDDQWIYFPSKNIPIGRMSEMKNFSKEMSPAGKTSLFVEYFCFEGDDLWNMDDDALVAKTIEELVKTGFIEGSEVRKGYVIRKKDVYPVYDLEYQKHLKVIMDYIDSFENLYAIGRPGRFRYNNQDHSLEMGFLAAKGILDGKKYDFDSVGAEDEYYEKGSVPTQKES